MEASLDIICGMRNKVNSGTIFLCSIVLVFVVSLIWGFVLVGPPSMARKEKNDEQRMRLLQDIHWSIQNYGADHEIVPDDLSEIGSQLGYVDSEALRTFTYKKVSPLEYELCTTFELDNTPNMQYSAPSMVYPMKNSMDISNYHAAGEVCYELSIVLNTIDEPVLIR